MAILDQWGKPIQSARTQQFIAERRERRLSLQAAYDAVKTTPDNQRHWANADLLSAKEANSKAIRDKARSRSRYECDESNSFAYGIVDTLVNDTISRGPRLQVNFQSKQMSGVARRIEAEFMRWARKVNLARLLRTARRAKAVDGEAFIQRITNSRLGTQVQLDLRLNEADQIASPVSNLGDKSKVDGLILDENNNVIGYERLREHPGDMFGYSYEADTISADDMIHLFKLDRPGQYRGMPEMITALPLFALLRRYTIASVLAAETAAEMAAVMYSDSPSVDPDEVEPLESIEFALRSIMTLPQGWKLNQVRAEHPTTTYAMFRDAVVMEIARCVSMPKNKALGSSDGYNYASGRLDHQTYFDAISIERDYWETAALDRILEWWLDEALLIEGYLPSLGTFRDVPHVWIWDQPQQSDPAKQASAERTQWDLGLLTDEEIWMSRGIDPDDQYDRLERQLERRRALGLPLPGFANTGDPSRMSAGVNNDQNADQNADQQSNQ